jgi:hypothetical protein
MAATQLYSDPEEGFDALLKQGARVKHYVAEVTEKYATSPESALDGTIHPSLRALGPPLPVVSSGKNAVVRGPKKEENEETDL